MQLATRLSLVGMWALWILSFSFGFHNYSETRQAIVSDLNRALQQTLLTHSEQWMNQDTLRTYMRLSEILGNPISIETHNPDFAEALYLTPLKKKSGIIIHILNKEEKSSSSLSPLPDKGKTESYLTSDTILWLAGNMPSSFPHEAKIGLSFQGYTTASFGTIFLLMNKSLPGVFLLLALLCSSFYLYLYYSRKFVPAPLTPYAEGRTVSYGNITLSCDKASFYKEDQEKLKMTPQQYTLMEMFFLSPTHILTRTDICDALWPGKINADETLNTLIRRIRPLIEENSNLKITTDRGRAYILEINEDESGK